METFNEKIKRIRKSRGLNQNEVCSQIGITQPSLASIEAGKTKSIAIELGKKIAIALNVSFNELFDIEISDNSKAINEENEQLKKRIGELESQLQDKTRLEKYLEKDILGFTLLILNWIGEVHATEREFTKLEFPGISEDSEQFKNSISETTDNEVELLVSMVKGGYVSVSDIEKEFGNQYIFSDLISKFRKLL